MLAGLFNISKESQTSGGKQGRGYLNFSLVSAKQLEMEGLNQVLFRTVEEENNGRSDILMDKYFYKPLYVKF